MQSTESLSGFDLVHTLLVQKGRATTADLSLETGLDNSTVSRHLNALIIAGLATRRRRGRTVEYHPRRNLYVSYTGPLGKESAQRPAPWDKLDWRADFGVNWRFPLASRIRDSEGHRTLLRMLHRFDQSGLFHAWLTFPEDTIEEWINGQPEEHKQALHDVLNLPSTWGEYHVVVFGSCARGDARPDSDLDILIIGPSRENWEAVFEAKNIAAPPFPSWQEKFKKTIDDINLGASRYIDAILTEESHVVDTPDHLKKSIIDEGITTFTTTGTELGIEAWRLERETHSRSHH